MRLIDADATIKEIKARNPDDVSYEDAWAITCIEHAPTIEPERTGMWIPCSERLPGKHGEMYLVTISDGSVYSCALQWDANKKRWYLSFLNNGKILVDYIDDVIAWMPLPEPYCPNCGARMEE